MTEFINRAEALAMLTTIGDYSEAQAEIILTHSRKWRRNGGTVFSRDYIQTRVGASLPR